MNRDQRIWRIVGRLGGASELTLHRIETELGLTPRPESPDAGRPWVGCSFSRCDLTRTGCPCPEILNPMTPVSERGMHE